jgi:hypothetical protein
MTDYPHKPFIDPPPPNEAKERRKKQLDEVLKRRAIIMRLRSKYKRTASRS